MLLPQFNNYHLNKNTNNTETMEMDHNKQQATLNYFMLGTHHKIIGLILGQFPPSDNPR